MIESRGHSSRVLLLPGLPAPAPTEFFAGEKADEDQQGDHPDQVGDEQWQARFAEDDREDKPSSSQRSPPVATCSS